MLGSVILTVATLHVAVSAKPHHRAFHIPYINAHQPSGRPGNSPYCTIFMNVTDAATHESTSCELEFGPCVSNTDAPTEDLPTEDAPSSCEDVSFNFWVPEYQNIGNYSVHIVHESLDNEGDVVIHQGETLPITRNNYPNGYRYTCGGSGVCNAYYSHNTAPIVVPFSKSDGENENV